ncbi:hypothetical protein GCM10022409_29030 [Hymenobacter glaciei]|uniref:DUF418 domain-containing protein n=2 Tax=Hymenobacter glaciei TaxID=877209 RepID=A0ABP7UDX7_9BACT
MVLLYACGIYNLLFAAFHVAFWRLFRWKSELAKLNPVNRAIMQVLNLRLIYVLLLFGALYLLFPEALRTTALGHFLLAGTALCWLGRLVEQLFFLQIRSWQLHFMTLVFVLGTVLHGLAFWMSR